MSGMQLSAATALSAQFQIWHAGVPELTSLAYSRALPSSCRIKYLSCQQDGKLDQATASKERWHDCACRLARLHRRWAFRR